MKDRLKAWRDRDAFKLSEAALLMTENYPEEYRDEKTLFEMPPKDFIAVYGQLLIDAVKVKDAFAQSEEVEGELYTEYVLNTDNPENVKKLSDSEGLNVLVDKYELIRYITTKKIQARFFTDDSLREFETNESLTKSDCSEKSLHPRTENNYLRLILTLAAGIKDFDQKKPYEAANLIINETGIDISVGTLAGYITKACVLESKKRD